ncbi:MAG: hypothetical protein ACJ72Z_11585 [Pyrinomonadaceae bacterium]
MKKIARSAFLGLFAALLIAAGSAAAYAQAGCDDTDKINELDAKIRENSKKKSTLKVAADSGKEFLEKFGACEATKEFTDWLKVQMPKWETLIKEKADADANASMFSRFDAGITGEKYEESYAAGRDILAKDPENLNIIVPLGAIGLYQSYNKNYKFNDDSIRYAKMAIAKLKAGAVSKKPSGKFGAFQFEYTKDEAISELTYALAYMNYWAKGDKKAALPYYYEVSQLPGKYQTEPRVFATIADYYIGEAAKLGEEVAKLIEKQKAATAVEEKEKIDVEIKAKVGLFNGYTERAIDAFSRAHKVAPSATAAEKTYKEGLYKSIQDLYKRRFDKEAGMNEYITATLSKPFPNPTSEVTPINDPDPVTTTSTAAPATPANGKTAASTKP